MLNLRSEHRHAASAVVIYSLVALAMLHNIGAFGVAVGVVLVTTPVGFWTAVVLVATATTAVIYAVAVAMHSIWRGRMGVTA